VALVMLEPAIQMRFAWLMLMVAGCGGAQGSSDAGAAGGSATVRFVPQMVAGGPLQLVDGDGQLEDVLLYGDVQSSPNAMLHDISFDPLAPSTDVAFRELPQGLYSRLRVSIDWLSLAGSWNQTPLQLRLEIEDEWIDLRTPTAQELNPGGSITLGVSIDVQSWFASVDLSSAVVDDGVIRIDGLHNTALTRAIGNAVPASFSLVNQ
jgi:hypothetical protein